MPFSKFVVSSLLCLITVFMMMAVCIAMSTGRSHIRNPLMVEDLRFTPPCPEIDYNFHPETGNFLCVIPTAKQCFEECQYVGCTEWFFANLMSSTNQSYNPYHRCRCVPRMNMCLYNPIPPEFRDF
ncbi:hypothetical protein EG68_01971 [Paragonimus skrjabini miyazakii]|uniref:Uncharacterized protein n=1 Tax=Paragonimus skrjabini miyazakii TaxID=59628 RepID=A0A8S9Z5B5_9TREM|nr:hypothetical protein EG68_01971 [Paragonimus skrjabini miyazakii]